MYVRMLDCDKLLWRLYEKAMKCLVIIKEDFLLGMDGS